MTSPTKATGLRRIKNACGYSFVGLKTTFQDEAAFRQEVVLCALLAPLAIYMAPDRLSLALMLGSLFLVLIVEILNSAIEATVDRFGSERHPLAKKAKDAGSAAVFVALLLVVVVWSLILA